MSALPTVGRWSGSSPAFSPQDIAQSAADFRQAAHVVVDEQTGALGVGLGGQLSAGGGLPCVGALPPIYPEWLGDRSFGEVHRVRFPYVAGAMARGIGSTAIVIAMGRAGMLGFFGSAGLSLPRVEQAIDEIEAALGNAHPWGCNLIHSPNEPDLEEGLVDLLLARGVRRVSASAYMGLTPAVVRYAYSGVTESGGQLQRQNYVFAKISRPETAARFMTPAPEAMLAKLVAAGKLTADEARLAARLPVAEDYTVESDSGGHTDNQILAALFPTIASVRDRLTAEHGYTRPIRLGAAGGLGTPTAIASAFALGAAYVLTGSVNQGAVEAGVSESSRVMLAGTKVGDTTMAPSADMFEMGVKVQVLSRGTMFAPRAQQLYDLYAAHDSLESIPADVRQRLETQLFRRPMADIWADTRSFWSERNPREVERAEADPKHKMALIFRWYVGQSSRWPIVGTEDRRVDYQLWCGPAMAAFNDWVAGSFLEPPEQRTVVQIARNLLEGAAQVTRAQALRSAGVPVPATAFHFEPRELS